MNILVTGAGGYFGRFLKEYVERYFPGYKIYYLDRVFHIDKLSGGHRFIRCDLKNFRHLKKILIAIRPRIIFHLAGSGISINYSWRDFFDMNFTTTKTLLEAVNSVKGFNPRIVIMGSAAEYGKPAIPRGSKKRYISVDEDFPLNPVSAYGCVKAMQTILARYYANVCGNDIVIIRPFNIIGPDMSPHTAIGNFQRQIKEIIFSKKKTARILTGDIKVKRDYVDIRDAMKAFCEIALKGRSAEIYNVSSGKSVGLEYILKKMCYYLKGIKIKILRDRRFLRKNDVSDIRGSNKKLKLHTGWRPTIKIEKSIGDWYEMILKKNGSDDFLYV